MRSIFSKETCCLISVFLCSLIGVYAQKTDSIVFDLQNRGRSNLQDGASSYVAFSSVKLGLTDNMFVLNTYIMPLLHEGEPVYSIEQRWITDTVFYHDVTLVSAVDFSTIYHSYWWKHTGLRIDHDIRAGVTNRVGASRNSNLASNEGQISIALNEYKNNWYLELFLFPIAPFSLYRTFGMKVYDPVVKEYRTLYYRVSGTEELSTGAGQKLDCWIIEHRSSINATDYNKFWVYKKTGEVIRQENFINGMYLHRVKLMTHPPNAAQ